MADKLSVPEFAARVKSKYPEYQALDDHELTQKVIEKFPEYRGEVDLDSGRTLLDIAVPAAARIGGTVVGGIAGTAINPGLGTAGGSAIGGGLGELLAEAYEKRRGLRTEINPTQVVTQTALSAIPGGRAANIGRRVVQNAALAGAGAGVTELAEGRTPELKDIMIAMGVGGVLGATPVHTKTRELAPTAPVIKDAGVQTSKSTGIGDYLTRDAEVQAGRPIGSSLSNKAAAIAPDLSAIPRGKKAFFGDPFIPVPEQGAMGERQKFGSPNLGENKPKRGIQLDSFPKEIRPSLQAVVDEHQGFEQQRRGVQSWARTNAISQKIAIDLKTTLPKGRVLKAEEQGAYGNALTSITSQIDDLVSRDPSKMAPEDWMKLEELRASQLVTMSSLYGSVTETGRALNYWKSLKQIMESHDERFIRKALEVAEGDVSKVATALREIKDPVARYEWLRNSQRLTPAEGFRTYVYANMLSGPRTHGRNFIGNTARVLFDVAAEAPRRPIATSYKVAGMLSAIPRASKEFAFQMRNGFSLEAAQGSAFDTIYKELPGGGLNPFNDVLRLLSASDSFTKVMIRNGELYQKAYREALKEGKRGTELISRAAELREVPKAEWLKEADDVATNTTFQGKLGSFSTHLQKAFNSVPGGFMVMPFVKIATNITKAGAEASPLGFLTKTARSEGRLGELARARASLGSAMLVFPAYLASQGLISGNGPSDPTKKALLMQSGWRPNSIKIGDKWVDYTNFQPIGVPFSVVANFAEALNDARNEGRNLNVEQMASEVVFKTANSILNQSFLQGVNNVFQALSDQTPITVGKVTKGFVQQAIPFSAAMRTAAQMKDPIIRIPENIKQQAQEIIPGQSHKVEPLLDPYGRPTVRNNHPLNPIGMSTEVNDPVTKFLLENNIPLARPSRRLEGTDRKPIELPPDEATALAMARGFSKRSDLEGAIRRANGRDPDRQKQIINEAKNRSSSEITRRARRSKQRGEKLDPRSLVNRRLVDELYQSYLSSRQ